MTLKEILNISLLETEKLAMTISDIIIVVLIIVITKTIMVLLTRILKKQSAKSNMDIGKGHSILQLVKNILWITAIVICLDITGINITIFLAGSAALLVGLGLGLQHVFLDFISGIILIFEGSIKVGDIVEIQEHTVGKIKEMKNK
jgi:small-conductance mechanosensitive channel